MLIVDVLILSLNMRIDSPKKEKLMDGGLSNGLTLQACAVRIVRDYPHALDSEQAELVKVLAVRRGVSWAFGGEITEALDRAKRYEPIR